MPLIIPPTLEGKLLRARKHADTLDTICYHQFDREPCIRRKLEDLLVYLHHYGCVTDSTPENWTYDPNLAKVELLPDHGPFNFYLLFYHHRIAGAEMSVWMEGGLSFHGPEEITPGLQAGIDPIPNHAGWSVNT